MGAPPYQARLLREGTCTNSIPNLPCHPIWLPVSPVTMRRKTNAFVTSHQPMSIGKKVKKVSPE